MFVPDPSLSKGDSFSQNGNSPAEIAPALPPANEVVTAISTATRYLRPLLTKEPEVMIVLGSGLGDVVAAMSDRQTVPFSEIPGFQSSTVAGHSGQFHFGSIDGCSVLLQQGRTHYYEGGDRWRTVLPLLVGKSLGASTFILTNATGSIEPSIPPESLVVVTNIVAPQMRDPLLGMSSQELGEMFYDMTHPLDLTLCGIAESHFREFGITTSRGACVWMEGPRYETAAEIADLRARGWIIRNVFNQPDLAPAVVGMSLAPEVAALSRDGTSRILGLSFVSNYAAGVEGSPITHAEVLERGQSFATQFTPALRALIAKLNSGAE